MNIAGGAQKVKQANADLDISADEFVEAERALAGSFSVRARNTRAERLDVRSSVTGWPDGTGMNIAGGAQKVKQADADLDISADEFVEAERATALSFGGRAFATSSGAPACQAAA